uniref:Pancreas transcription factor 1 subunit alpha n=1 Tax=Ascaris suum TaxID=6253 RepID=F1LDZ1_ASCSU
METIRVPNGQSTNNQRRNERELLIINAYKHPSSTGHSDIFLRANSMHSGDGFSFKHIYVDHIHDNGYRNASTGNACMTIKRRKEKSNEVMNRQRKAANERERKRMCSINKGFDKLRLRLPTMPYEKKLSKMDTLKQAIEYIQQLSKILAQRDESDEGDGQTIDQQPSTLLISSSNDSYERNTAMLALSWSKISDRYGSTIRDERGVAHAQCAKIWTPGI